LNLLCDGAESRVRCDTNDNEGAKHMSVFQGPTNFEKMTDELINKYYLEGEQWLIVNGIQSLLSINSSSTESDNRNTNPSDMSDAVDGCFYILQRCSLRSLGTHHIHAACATLHLISDHLSGHVLRSFSDKLNASVNKIFGIVRDNMNKFLHANAEQSSAQANSSSSGGGSTLALGIQSALLLAASITSGTATSNTVAKPSVAGRTNSSAKLSESESLGGSSNSSVWGMASVMEIFNQVELCVQYTESLKSEILKTGNGIFGLKSSEDNSDSRGSKLHERLIDDYQKFVLCVEEFNCCKEHFSQVL
jgi:hypothetical protein